MIINLIDCSNNIQSVYHKEVSGDVISSIEGRTILPFAVLNNKNEIMDNRQFIEELRTLLSSRFNNDIELLARNMGIPVDHICGFLSGTTDPPRELIGELERRNSTKEENYFQFGNRVEINNSGDGLNQSYAGILSDDKDDIKRLKKENSSLRKLAKGKDDLLRDKDELLKEKDKIISTLQEAIELLRNKEQLNL